MNINISINLRPSLKPLENEKPVGNKITYSEARNLPLPNNMEHAEHLIKEGETLATIAEQYGLTAVHLSEFLREVNGNDYINVGEKIPIPTELKEI